MQDAVLDADHLPLPGEVLQEPQHDAGGEDDGERLFDIMLEFIPQMHHQVVELRCVIGRQLHNKGSDLAAHGGLAHECDHDDRHRHAEHIQRKDEQIGTDARVLRGDRAADGGEDGGLGAAGKEGDDAVGHCALLFIGEGARVDSGGHRAAEPHDHRDEGAAGQAEFAERAVEDERHARHITRIFQNGDKQEEGEDLRDEGQNARDAAPDPLVDQALRPRRGARRLHAQRDTVADLTGDKVHQIEHDGARRGNAVRRKENGDQRVEHLAAGIHVVREPRPAVEPAGDGVQVQKVGAEREMEHRKQDDQKDRDPPNAVREHAVRPIRAGEILLLFGSLVGARKVRRYVFIARIRDERFEISAEQVARTLFLERLDGGDLCGVLFDLQFIPFDQLNGMEEGILDAPAVERDGHIADNMVEGRAFQYRPTLPPLRSGLEGALHQLFDALAL